MSSVQSPKSESPLQIRLFGTFSLRCEGVDAPAPRSRAAHWLIAWLLLRRKMPVERGWLAETLWPRSNREDALFNLRRNLTEARKVLGSEAHRLQSPTPQTLWLDATGCDCDLLTFEAALLRGEVTALEQAIALYAGDLLEGCREDWILPERFRCEQQYCAALERLAAHEYERCGWEQAAYWLRLLIAREPEREAAQQQLMTALAQQGNFAAATEVYHRLRRTLRDTLNTTPSEQTVAVYERLKQQALVPSVPVSPARARPPVSGMPRPLGELTGREREPEIAFRNLPQSLNSFVGRTEEREQIYAALQSSRMVTLVGPGGVGKTRLALAAGQIEPPNYPAGVCFADLSATRTEADLLIALVAVCSLPLNPNGALLPLLLRFLSPRRLLIIFDNVEQVATPCAHLASTLLQNCPQLTILATSRQPLSLAGEVVLTVSPLAIPEAQSLANGAENDLGGLVQCASVALLLDRVAAAAPDFRLDASNASAITAICRRLEGLPLALELAAARFRSLSASDIARHLDLRFRLLSSGDPTLPRHHSLNTALDWSYDLLIEGEQTLFRRLSVFRGGWTLDAVEAVSVEQDNTLALLSSLVDKSLVVYERQAGPGRYRLLEMTRQYAFERLQEQEQAEIEPRHAEYFLRMAEASYETASPGVLTFPNEAILPERDNFHAAYTWYIARDLERALWLEHFLYYARVWPRDNMVTRIAQIEQTPLSPTHRGLQIVFWAGEWALWNRHPACEALLLRLLETARVGGSIEFQRGALGLLGALEGQRGNFDRSREYAEAWLCLVSPETTPHEISAHRSHCALNLARAGQVENALNLLKTQLHEEIDQQEWASVGTTNQTLGEMLLEQKEYRAARPYLEEATAFAVQWSPHNLTYLWRYQARAAKGVADYSHAWHCLEQALLISRQNRQKDREAWTRCDMADLAFHEGRREETAIQMWACMLALKENEEETSLIECLQRMAKYYLAWGEYAGAVTLLGSAKSGIEHSGVKRTEEEEKQVSELMTRTGALLDKADWQAAWRRGKQMTLTQAMDFVKGPGIPRKGES